MYARKDEATKSNEGSQSRIGITASMARLAIQLVLTSEDNSEVGLVALVVAAFLFPVRSINISSVQVEDLSWST